MLQFFRINDPYRILFIALLLLIIRVPLIILSISKISINELEWLISGEYLSNGHILYKDLITELGPLSAWLYQALYYLFGSSKTVYYIISYFVVFWQAVVFNAMLLSNKVYRENTYIPGFFYVVLLSFNIETLTLSPQLLGLTFVLLAINNIFRRLDQTVKNDLFSVTGVYIAIASLFYFPYILLLPATIISLSILSNPKPKRIVLMTVSVVQIFLLVGCYFLAHDSVDHFIQYFILSSFSTSFEFLVAPEVIIYACIPTITILVLVTLKVVLASGYINSQRRFFYAILIISLFCSVSIGLDRRLSTISMLMITLPTCFFLVHYLLQMKKKWLAELYTVLGFILIVSWSLIPLVVDNSFISYEKFIHHYRPENTQKKSVIVLSNHPEFYLTNRFSGGYLNWSLSQPIFQQVQSIENLLHINQSIKEDRPEMIYDPDGYMEAIMEIIPTINATYERSASDFNLIFRKP